MMRLSGILVACSCLFSSQAGAFDLDGFFSGMTRADALKKLDAAGLIPRSAVPDDQNQIAAGPYQISFCGNGRIAGVTNRLDFREFNSYLLSALSNHGEPKVDIPSPDYDIL